MGSELAGERLLNASRVRGARWVVEGGIRHVLCCWEQHGDFCCSMFYARSERFVTSALEVGIESSAHLGLPSCVFVQELLMPFPPRVQTNLHAEEAETARVFEGSKGVPDLVPSSPRAAGTSPSTDLVAAQTLQQQNAQVSAVLEALGEAVLLYDTTGAITYMTDAARTMLGIRADVEYADMPLEQRRARLLPTDAEGNPVGETKNLRSVSRLLAGEVLRGATASEMTLRTLDGRVVQVQLSGKPLRSASGQITGAAAVLRDVSAQRLLETERKELLARAQAAQAEAEDAASKLRALQAVTDTALSSLPLDDLLQALLERVRLVMEVDAAAVLLLTEQTAEQHAEQSADAADIPRDPERGVLVVRAAVGLQFERRTPFLLPVGQGFAGRVAQSRAPLIADDLRALEGVGGGLSDVVRSALGVPLLLGERLLGVLYVAVVAQRHFTAEDVDLLEQVADRVGRAIEQAQLYTHAQRVAREAQTRSRELEAVFDSISDAVAVYNVEAQIVRSNRAMSDLFGYHLVPGFSHYPLVDRAARVQVMTADGERMPIEMLPQSRALRGEVLTGASSVDLRVRTLYDTTLHVSANAAPLRDAEGNVVGAVVVFRDVTDRQLSAERTHEALEGFLAITRALVEAPMANEGEEGTGGAEASGEERSVAYQLSDLTCSVLGCQRVSVSVVDPVTLLMRPIAVVGLDPALEAQWWAEQRREQHFGEGLSEEHIARMLDGEALVFDLTQPPYDAVPNLYGITTLLIAPMVMQGSLVGMLALDYRGNPHVFTSEEIAIAEALARLGAVVLERERLLREREEARGRAFALTEANRRMDEFMGIAGHELRTPLTTVKANLQLAQRRAKRIDEEFAAQDTTLGSLLRQLQDLLQRSRAATDRQERLVQDLLDVSRISAGKLEYRMAPLDLTSLVRRTADDLQLLAAGRTLHVQVPQEAVTVTADPDRIGQVVSNYVTNAMKYSASELPISIRLRRKSQCARVEVQDRGPGLTHEQQQHLFERFERVPGIEVVSGSGVGLGLGLYICRTIVEQHGGRVGVASKPGAGSTFWFELPLLSAPEHS